MHKLQLCTSSWNLFVHGLGTNAPGLAPGCKESCKFVQDKPRGNRGLYRDKKQNIWKTGRVTAQTGSCHLHFAKGTKTTAILSPLKLSSKRWFEIFGCQVYTLQRKAFMVVGPDGFLLVLFVTQDNVLSFSLQFWGQPPGGGLLSVTWQRLRRKQCGVMWRWWGGVK